MGTPSWHGDISLWQWTQRDVGQHGQERDEGWAPSLQQEDGLELDTGTEGGHHHRVITDVITLLSGCFPASDLLGSASQITEKHPVGNNRDHRGHWPQNHGLRASLKPLGHLVKITMMLFLALGENCLTWVPGGGPGMGVETPSAARWPSLSTDSRGPGFRGSASSWTSAFKA